MHIMIVEKKLKHILVGVTLSLISLTLMWCGWSKSDSQKIIDSAEEALDEGINDLDGAAWDLLDEAKELLWDDADIELIDADDSNSDEGTDTDEMEWDDADRWDTEGEDLDDTAEEVIEEGDEEAEKEEEKEELIVEKEMPLAPEWTADKKSYESIIWGSRYTSNGDATSLFTFRWNNTFMFNVDGNDTQGEWTVEDGKILVGDEELELEIIWENEIKINGVTYKRNANDGV